MTPFERILEFLVKNWRVDAAIVAKVGVMVFLGLYLVFALMVVRQIKLMSQTINGLSERWLIAGAWALVGLAGAALMLGLIVL